MPPLPGLYDDYLTPEEIRDHQAVPRNDLSSEIWLLRAMAGRYLGYLKALSPSGEVEINDSLLRGLARVMGGIASILNTHMQLNSPLSAIANEIEAGLQLARAKLGILSPQELLDSGFPPCAPFDETSQGLSGSGPEPGHGPPRAPP